MKIPTRTNRHRKKAPAKRLMPPVTPVTDTVVTPNRSYSDRHKAFQNSDSEDFLKPISLAHRDMGSQPIDERPNKLNEKQIIASTAPLI